MCVINSFDVIVIAVINSTLHACVVVTLLLLGLALLLLIEGVSRQ
jgi:hypothetical protein